jgi:hypothetical protein
VVINKCQHCVPTLFVDNTSTEGVHFFITANDSYGNSCPFLTYGHFMSRPTAFHCRAPDLY